MILKSPQEPPAEDTDNDSETEDSSADNPTHPVHSISSSKISQLTRTKYTDSNESDNESGTTRRFVKPCLKRKRQVESRETSERHEDDIEIRKSKKGCKQQKEAEKDHENKTQEYLLKLRPIVVLVLLSTETIAAGTRAGWLSRQNYKKLPV